MSSETFSPGKIFLADDRGYFKDKTHQRYSTFNFEEFQNSHKQPFGNLQILNDIILSQGEVLSQETKVDGIMLLIPVVGGIRLKINNEFSEADAGEVLSVSITKGCKVEIINPFESDWVNFLYIELSGQLENETFQKYIFDIEQTFNSIITVINDARESFKLSIGRFGGREDFTYHVEPESTIFGYVIGGAFEFQNRLMHERDGVALWNVSKIEAEALSNGAVVLILELR